MSLPQMLTCLGVTLTPHAEDTHHYVSATCPNVCVIYRSAYWTAAAALNPWMEQRGPTAEEAIRKLEAFVLQQSTPPAYLQPWAISHRASSP